MSQWRYLALQIVKAADRADGINLDEMSAAGSCAWFRSQIARADSAADRMANFGRSIANAGLVAALEEARSAHRLTERIEPRKAKP